MQLTFYVSHDLLLDELSYEIQMTILRDAHVNGMKISTRAFELVGISGSSIFFQ